MNVRRYEEGDWSELMRMARELFPDIAEEDVEDLLKTIGKEDAQVFVIDRGDGILGGYVEAGTRSVADGCKTGAVGYIEAWYVDPDLRRAGYGRALLESAESWARDRGFREMASDALLDNHVSHAAHKRSGYIEVDKVITYRKSLY
ncbi:MAG: N-acetyltransferase family protein [Gemmatimonadaceae bacterium]